MDYVWGTHNGPHDIEQHHFAANGKSTREQARALRSLLDAGYDPDASVEFLRSDDLSRLLGPHPGLFSVQLQPPGADRREETPTPPEEA